MKLRISKDLYDRLRKCAQDVGDTIGEYVDLCMKHVQAGKIPQLDYVTSEAKRLLATYRGCVITIHETDAEPSAIREAILSTVLWVEARRPPEFKTELREELDYYVAPLEETC